MLKLKKIIKKWGTNQIVKLKNNIKRGTEKIQNFIKINQKLRCQKCQEIKRSFDKVENFLQQVKRGPYYICTICHRKLCQRSVRLFKHEKYHILATELYHPVKSFDKKLYIRETCHKCLHKNEISCQAVCNKIALRRLKVGRL